MGIASPIVGFLVDRLGPRKLMLFGVSLGGLSLILLSRVSSLPMFYAVIIMVSIGFSASSPVVMMTTVANWFRRRVSRAMGFLMVGFGLSGLMIPGIVWLIAEWGWRNAALLLGAGVWVVGFPAAMIIRHRPEDYGYLPDGQTQEEAIAQPLPADADFNVSRALRTSAFWLLALSIGLQSMVLQAVILHIMPYLTSIGLSRQVAAWIAMFIPLFSVAGRLGLGWLGDLWDKKVVLCLAFGLQTAGMIIFIYARSWSLFLPFLLLFGVGYGGTIPLRAAIQREYFGRTAFGGIQGLMVSVMTGLSILGPPLAGRVFDVTGSYHTAWVILSGALFLTIPLILGLRPPARKVTGLPSPGRPL